MLIRKSERVGASPTLATPHRGIKIRVVTITNARQLARKETKMFNFGKFNKKRLFNVELTGDEEYTNLETLVHDNGMDAEYRLRAVYIGTKSQFDPETPLVLIDGFYVNLPQHQLAEVKAILNDQSAIRAINDGTAGFKIVTYEQKKFRKTCYAAEWCSVEPDDDDDPNAMFGAQ